MEKVSFLHNHWPKNKAPCEPLAGNIGQKCHHFGQSWQFQCLRANELWTFVEALSDSIRSTRVVSSQVSFCHVLASSDLQVLLETIEPV